ncbi:MAG: hypothetical protein CJBNEKGG_02251 [Prosthecobacter sp.]|nr:hypothetical protein [Prosthecobacter sp.]
MPDPAPAFLPAITSRIREVFRQNRLPCLLLNLLVLLLVGSYYQVPAMAKLWQAVGDFKTRWSYGFSLTSTLFAAVLLPSLVQGLMGTLPAEGRLRRILMLVLFWGYRGMEIDLFYHFQGWLFGTGNDAGTLLTKVLFDQFVMSPLWFVPTYLIALRWVDMGGSWRKTRASLDREFWTLTLPTVMLTNWLVWIPALALIYSLPPALQFPLFSLIMCFFILIVTLLARPAQEVPRLQPKVEE